MTPFCIVVLGCLVLQVIFTLMTFAGYQRVKELVQRADAGIYAIQSLEKEGLGILNKMRARAKKKRMEYGGHI